MARRKNRRRGIYVPDMPDLKEEIETTAARLMIRKEAVLGILLSSHRGRVAADVAEIAAQRVLPLAEEGES